ncbi:unannotated protein [freshwater metagenome]|uniref:Unannotated protein n=1 Tax=freshwater metagenome TaxID=449393 RepID=A0A6J6NKU0_9ZZZZ
MFTAAPARGPNGYTDCTGTPCKYSGTGDPGTFEAWKSNPFIMLPTT